jgi:hypothetical protein
MLQVPYSLLGSALPVKCVNCGGEGSLSLILAIVSLAVAIIAAVSAARLYNMQREEHQVFMTELTRRAQVAITVVPIAHVQPVESGTVGRTILRLTFDNSGTKAAHHAIVNVLVPESGGHFERCLEDGAPHPEPASAIRSSQDVPWEGVSKMLGWKWDILTLTTNRVAFVCLSLGTGAECPVRVNLASDDLAPPCQVNCDYTARATGNAPPEPPAAIPGE